MARQRPLTRLEEKMVRADLVVFVRACNIKFCLTVLLEGKTHLLGVVSEKTSHACDSQLQFTVTNFLE